MADIACEARYSVAHVAYLLMMAAELYQRVTAAGTQRYDPSVLCPHGLLFYDYRANGRRGRACRTCASEVHATIAGRNNLSESERVRFLDELIDLDEGMNRLMRRNREGIGRFLDAGPRSFDEKTVTFRHGQAHHVLTLTKAMNGDEE